MRSIKTEGALRFAAQAFGAQVRETLAVLEAHERGGWKMRQQVSRRVARAGRVAVGDEAAAAGGDAGDLAGAQIDQEIELGVAVGEGGGDDGAVGGMGGEPRRAPRRHRTWRSRRR